MVNRKELLSMCEAVMSSGTRMDAESVVNAAVKIINEVDRQLAKEEPEKKAA